MPKYQSPALDKGLDILEYLSLNEAPQSQTEIATGINKMPNQIYRMLVCLEDRGYIDKDVVSGKFSLSLKLYYLSHCHSPINAIRKAAFYPMQELSEFSGQSCHLSILYKHSVLVIAQSLSSGPISLSVEEGGRFSLCGTTSGRLILSQFPQDERLILLNKTEDFVKMPEPKQQELLLDIVKISEDGYNIRSSETTRGVYDIAIPFNIPEINITGTLAISVLSGESQKSISNEKVLTKMKSTVIDIYKKIGVNK
ncbi:helix-turn-helix domain-containing protein [Tamlana sp. 2201CG12-4]|uniref:IclR family transcriptional regulator n=1 Tax=Tamlana sp. 2201CG12-4 TaxID=3112582 RepID=UPI002DBFDC6D|nr:helix-turn-helix domain-containing protein [Tamlana sp. 2201CG12-4]MEC3907858.1 helix-turn-helix domain-containing protein [Tamlana sp. 2201CG12-4]